MSYKDLISTELLQAKNEVSNVNQDAANLRKQISDDEAAVIVKYIKQILSDVVGAGVAVPQDGGASLKSTMLQKINTLA